MGKKILFIAVLLVYPLLVLAAQKYHGTVTDVLVGEDVAVASVIRIDNKLFQLSNKGVKITVNDTTINVSELQRGMVVRYSLDGEGSIYRMWVIGPKKLIKGMLSS